MTTTTEINFSEETCIPNSIFEKKVGDVIYVKPFIPDGIAIKMVENLTTPERIQYGVFAKNNFVKGEVLWSSYINVITINEKQPLYLRPLYFMFNIPDVGYVPVSFYEHMVYDGSFGSYESFDCIMNHSCDPNSTIVDLQDGEDGCKQSNLQWFYKHIALKDIRAGEQMTTNYLLFCEGDEDDEGFICHCGSKNCCGTMRGFKNLPIEKQQELLPYVDEYFIKNWGL